MGVLNTALLQGFTSLLEQGIRNGALETGEMGRLQLQQVRSLAMPMTAIVPLSLRTTQLLFPGA